MLFLIARNSYDIDICVFDVEGTILIIGVSREIGKFHLTLFVQHLLQSGLSLSSNIGRKTGFLIKETLSRTRLPEGDPPAERRRRRGGR